MTLVLHADRWGDRQRKYDWLNSHEASDTQWAEVRPHSPSYWFVPRDATLQAEYEAGLKITDAMPVNSVGIVTARDLLTTQFSKSEMWDVLREFARMDPEKARNRFQLGPDAQDWRIASAQEDVNDGGPHPKLVLPILYRPFDTRFTYYTGRSRGLICRPRTEVMGHMLAGENLALITIRRSRDPGSWRYSFVTDIIAAGATGISSLDINYLLPLYLYDNAPHPSGDEDIRTRKPNLAPDFTDRLAYRCQLTFICDGRGDLIKTFGPDDVFAYIYGALHSPMYRTRYAEFLKIDFPRVPLTSNADLFRALCRKGQELVDLHLLRDERLSNPSFWGTGYPVAGAHDVTCVDYRGPGEMAGSEPEQSAIRNPQSAIETGRVYINKAQPRKGTHAEYFDGVPPEVWEFRIGGYQVLDHWLKERKRHKRSLTLEDVEHFQKVVAVLRETIRLMTEIDEVIDAHGGWPDAFQKG